MSKKKPGVCGPCQLGKQLKESHSSLQQTTTSRVLELLYIDLMGPMQVESIGGKRYVFVCVDDFSRFTWVDFIKKNQKLLMSLKDYAKN